MAVPPWMHWKRWTIGIYSFWKRLLKPFWDLSYIYIYIFMYTYISHVDHLCYIYRVATILKTPAFTSSLRLHLCFSGLRQGLPLQMEEELEWPWVAGELLHADRSCTPPKLAELPRSLKRDIYKGKIRSGEQAIAKTRCQDFIFLSDSLQRYIMYIVTLY